MSGSAHDFESYAEINEVVAAGVLGPTNAGTAAVDLGTCRQGWLLIDLVVGTDVPTNVILQDSADGVIWAAHTTVANADVAATGLQSYNCANIRRYARLTWTRAAAAGNSFWCVLLAGDLMRRAPAGT